jgi:hypothetical protein
VVAASKELRVQRPNATGIRYSRGGAPTLTVADLAEPAHTGSTSVQKVVYTMHTTRVVLDQCLQKHLNSTGRWHYRACRPQTFGHRPILRASMFIATSRLIHVRHTHAASASHRCDVNRLNILST